MKKWLKRTFYTIIILFLSLIVGFKILDHLYPLPEVKIDVSPVALDRNGEILRHFSSEEGIFRHWVTLDEVSPLYIDALLAYEDRFFYSHFGINPLATLRATFQWITHGKIISGSSTLTMQVARLLDPHERSISGKFKQMFRALQLEARYSKDEILTFYLNLAPMGGAIEGVETASWRYFSKHARDLNHSESALLVALPQRPSLYRPDLYPENARMARNKVLDRMAERQLIKPQQAEQIKKDPLDYRPQPTLFLAPLLSEQLRNQYPDAHRLETTIDKSLQMQIERYIARESKRWQPALSTAVIVIHNPTHEVYSYVGSADLFNQERFGYIDMAMAIRSPGSTLKPFVYGMALDYGIVHEASLLTDIERNFNGYIPKNFDNQERGAVPLYRALQQSLNIPVVQVTHHLTPELFIKTLRDSGIDILIDYPNLSVVLGGVGINLIEQARLFSSLGTEGKLYPLHFLKDHPSSSTTGSIMSPEASYLISRILSDVRPKNRYTKRRIAWKTGTSYGYRDAWALGVSPDWTIGVWIGRPDSVPNVGTLASQYALPMLFDLYNYLPNDTRDFPKPSTITRETICWPSGISKKQADLCDEEFTIDTVRGMVPPTLYDAPGEIRHNGWPAALKYHPNTIQDAKIITFADESIIFKTHRTLTLEARGKAPFLWYLNGELLPSNQLDIGAMPEGNNVLTVVDANQKRDRVRLEVREY